MKYNILTLLLIAVNFCYSEEFHRTINVNGSASIKVSADIFIISCKITGHDDKGIDISEKSAQNKLDELSKLINLEVLTITGRSSSKVLKTNSIGESVFNGYDTAIYFTLKTNEINKFRSYYKNVLGVSSIEISRVDYKSTKEIEYREKAREMALMAGKNKANQMAEIMSTKLGKVLKISELNSNNYDNRFANNISSNVSSDDSISDFMEGQIDITAVVNLEFEIQ